MESLYKKRAFVRYYFIFLVVFLFFILLNFFIHLNRTVKFNKVERIAQSGEKTNLQIDIQPRGGESDYWIKSNVKTDDGVHNFIGTIFDISLSNYYDCLIPDWKLKINIQNECYLNNAWCGTIEFHQNVKSGNEKVQTLDLRQLKQDQITLEYLVDAQDVLIHLYPGDYIIYNPAMDVGEIPLNSFTQVPGKATIGMIFYYLYSMDFSNYQINYRLKKNINQGTEFTVFLILMVVWAFFVIYISVFLFVTKASEKELLHKEEMLEESLDLISHFVDAKDTYTQGHSARVANYTLLLAQKLGMSERESKYAYYAGVLHDIGKCYVPDEVLKKPGKLTDEEFAIIKSHTTYGEKMLRGIKSIPGIMDGAYYHHEKYNGKGYPTGRKGEEIPFIARIICVADSFDAMNSSRCYRKNLTKEYILNEISSNKGTQFDPDVAEAMLLLIKEGKITVQE